MTNMATAAPSTAAATNPAIAASQAAYPGLWHGKKIPIIGLAGPTNSGKTLFLLTTEWTAGERQRSLVRPHHQGWPLCAGT